MSICPTSRSLASLAVCCLLATGTVSCQDPATFTPPSLRSPASFAYAPRCIVDGVWQRPADCPDGVLVPFGYVANEENAALSFLQIGSKGASLVDTRKGVPGITSVLIGGRPRALAATADGAMLVTVNTLTEDVSVVEAGQARELAVFQTPEPGMDIVRDVQTDELWIAFPSGRLEARTLSFDCGAGPGVYRDSCELGADDVSLDVTAEVTLEASPRDLIMDPVRRRMYVAHADALYVSVIALADSDETCLADGATPPCETARLPGGYGCSDGLDNDGDGFTDGADPQCYHRGGAESPEGVGVFAPGACNDGADNDGDGFIDAFDPGCASTNDASEEDGSSDPLVPSACTDGVDNDNDGLVDNRDPDCTWEGDDDESNAELVSGCDDGVDNDGDGAVDYPDDEGCSSFGDQTEDEAVACRDGVDNDGDGTIDMDDDGCQSPSDLSEGRGAGPCADGVDNDDDGNVDLGDAGCYGAAGVTEEEVQRIGLGPLGIDPLGRWLYVVDGSEWQVVVIDLEASTVVDAGALDPRRDGPGIGVTPLPRAIAGDIRSSVRYDDAGVVIERDEAVFYVASTAGTVELGTVHQTWRRREGDTITDTLELHTLHLGDNDGDSARTVGLRCVNANCDSPALPAITLRQRPTVAISDDGRLVTQDSSGNPLAVPADEIFTSEAWLVVREGALPNAARTDGVIDAAVPGRITSGGNFCTMGARPGDHVLITDAPIKTDDDACALFVGSSPEAKDPNLEWVITHVRNDAIYLETLGGAEDVQALPTRTCFPFGVAFEVRPVDTWVVEAEKTDGFHARATVAGVCIDDRNPLGGGRVAAGTRYDNALLSLDLTSDPFPGQRDVAFTFSVDSGFSAMRMASGPLPGDLAVVQAPARKYIFVPDAGSNQVFIYDAGTLNSLEPI